ncbi:MAG: hypothetical protein ACYC21_03605 [Eubacteriales bacterium]
MSQEMLYLGLPSPQLKTRKRRRMLAFLFLSILAQLILFYGAEKFLERNNGIDVEPPVKTEVRQRKINLAPLPDSPGTMAVSADHTMLAMTDIEKLRIYNLTNGQEVNSISLHGNTVGALQWLPDRNRLIYGLMNNQVTTRVVSQPIQQVTGVKDETYSTETYRQPFDYRTVTEENFKITLYSIDDQEGAVPEEIQKLQQPGQMPQKIELSLSTYTNLLYVYWTEQGKNYLVQVDIMKRIKDIPLLGGKLTRLVVSPRNGNMWAELTEDNLAYIYNYHRGHWKLQKHLDGYRLLGVTPDDQLAVALDQEGQAKEVFLVDNKGDFKPGWVFSSPIRLDKVNILSDGRLIYFDNNRVIIHTPQLGKGTVFNISKVDGYSPDMRMLVSWQQESNQLNIMEEVEETVKR